MPMMLPYLPGQSQPHRRGGPRVARGIRGEGRRLSRGGFSARQIAGLVLVVGLMACRGDRYTDWSDDRPDVERTSPWSGWALPAGRTVASDSDGLVVRYGHHGSAGEGEADVPALDVAWRGALAEAGFEVVRDQSRGDRISATFEEPGADGAITGSDGDGRQVAYAISTQAVRVGTRRERRRGESRSETSVTVSLKLLPAHARVPIPPPEPAAPGPTTR